MEYLKFNVHNTVGLLIKNSVWFLDATDET